MYHSSTRARGLTPVSSGLKSSTRGSTTGSWASGTPTGPQASQYTMGMGGPQYRWREMHQSRSRKFTSGSPSPRSESHAVIFTAASRQGMPSKSPLFTMTPSPTYASDRGVSAESPDPAATRTMGRSNWPANSKSRSSWPGTAMMAPVPYPVRT